MKRLFCGTIFLAFIAILMGCDSHSDRDIPFSENNTLQETLELTPENTSENLPIAVSEDQVSNDPAERTESDDLRSDNGTDLDEWLKENLWNILGNVNLTNIPEVRDYVNPRSAKLYLADFDGDGNYELIHSLFTGTYTTIDSVYKLSGGKLVFYGYYYSGLYSEDSGFTDGIYTNGSEQRTFCSRYVTSGGADQPYWIQIYEMKFDSGIKLVPILSGEWSPSSPGGEYRLVKAEYDGGVIDDEAEYHQWLADFLGDYTMAGDLFTITDSMDVPFSIGAKEFTPDEKVQEIIDWICGGLIKNGEPAGGESSTHALRKEKCTQALVDSFQSGIVNEQKGSPEQKIIYSLMDRDVLCYDAFRYASSAIEEETPYRDDIFEIKKHALFRDYSELKKFVHDTYSEEIAEKLLKERELDQALYFSEDQRFLYHAENLGISNFDIFSEGYEIEITHAGDDEIEFICYYSVWQEEEEKPVEKTALCRAKVIGNQWKLDRNSWLTDGNIDREITGLDLEALNASEAIIGQWSKDSFTFDTFTYAVEYDGETYTTETDPERFDESFRAMEGKGEKGDQRYKKINLGDRIGEAEVTECSYTCESFDSRDGIRIEPFRAALTLRGTVSLKGVIAYAEEGDDLWNIYPDTVMFFPYADSLKESRMPLLHTEKMDTVYYENGMPAFGFYGETLPFALGGSSDVLYNGQTFGELFGAKKFWEVAVQFEEVAQSWMYMNGSGWSPCRAKITKITLDAEPRCNGNELLCPPFNRTLESYNEEWSEDDVLAAWNRTDASEVYTEYTDRLFFDMDHDGSAELLLTSYSTKKMYFFKKANHRIELLFEQEDIDITNGNVIMPPTDKEMIKTKEVFDFQECHSFQFYHKEENIYVTGISWRPAVGKTCWVKKLILSKDNIGFDDVFRWGMFTEKDRIASVFAYRRYDGNGNYTYTTQREIDDFLQLLVSGNDETAKEGG